jgi:choice-of-anchor B domain-containing protein
MRIALSLSVLCLAMMHSFGLRSQANMNAELLYHWHDPSLPASFAHGNIYNEVWSLAWEGREYAVIGSTNGTHIFDVTDPVNAQEIHFVQGAAQGGTIIHRDFKNYAGYLYAVCDEGPSTLQIIDYSGLPETVDVVYDSNALFTRVHNIYIDQDNARMYTCGGNFQFDVYSLENPVEPVLLKRCQNQIPGWSTQVGYVHDAYVRDNIAYCNAEDGLWIVDFSDIENPVFLGDLSTYPESGYNHSGWLNEEGTIYVLADETHGMRLKVLDVTDHTDITIESFIGSGVHAFSIPHNVLVKDNIAHVSYYHDGYYAWDISDPVNPELLAYYNTSNEPNAQNYKGAWGTNPMLPSGIVLLSDMQEGLFVFEIQYPESTPEFGNLSTEVYPNPAQKGNVIQVETGISEGMVQMEFIGLDGKTVWSGAELVKSGTLKTQVPPSLNQGMYVLRIFAGPNQVKNIKILVQ